jgi:hypothetical protein
LEKDKQLEQIYAQRQNYVAKNYKKDKRDLDVINGTLADALSLLATLIKDLKKQGILK